MYPCRDPAIFYLIFLQSKTIRKSITKKILSSNNELFPISRILMTFSKLQRKYLTQVYILRIIYHYGCKNM